jgi:hypothetical protein
MAKLYLEGLELSIRAMVYFGGEKRVLKKFRRGRCFVEAATPGQVFSCPEPFIILKFSFESPKTVEADMGFEIFSGKVSLGN